jgi:hypothetical protein
MNNKLKAIAERELISKTKYNNRKGTPRCTLLSIKQPTITPKFPTISLLCFKAHPVIMLPNSTKNKRECLARKIMHHHQTIEMPQEVRGEPLYSSILPLRKRVPKHTDPMSKEEPLKGRLRGP